MELYKRELKPFLDIHMSPRQTGKTSSIIKSINRMKKDGIVPWTVVITQELRKRQYSKIENVFTPGTWYQTKGIEGPDLILIDEFPQKHLFICWMLEQYWR